MSLRSPARAPGSTARYTWRSACAGSITALRAIYAPVVMVTREPRPRGSTTTPTITRATLTSYVARGGFEPPHTAPKAAVLPLDDRAKIPDFQYSRGR